MANSIAFSTGGSGGGGMTIKNIYTGYEPFFNINCITKKSTGDSGYYIDWDAHGYKPKLTSRNINFPNPIDPNKSIIHIDAHYLCNIYDALINKQSSSALAIDVAFTVSDVTSTSFTPRLISPTWLSSTAYGRYYFPDIFDDNASEINEMLMERAIVTDVDYYLEHGDDEEIKSQIRACASKQYVVYPDIKHKFRWEVIEFE